MNKKPYPINGNEIDCTYARRIYCYLVNHPNVVKAIKRKMNKRFRKQSKENMMQELEELLVFNSEEEKEELRKELNSLKDE